MGLPFLSEKNELTDLLGASTAHFRSVGIFSAVINILALVPSLYMLQVYDRVMTSQNTTTLLVLTVITLGLLVVSALLDASRTFVLVRIGARFDAAINRRIYSAAFDFYQKTGKQISSQSLRDLTNVRQFLTGPGVLALFDVPWMPIYLGVLFIFDFWLGVLALVGAVISAFLTWMNNRSSSGLLKEANEMANKSGRAADDNTRNAEVVEAMGMLGVFIQRWRVDHLRFLNLQALASDKAGLWGGLSKSFRVFLQSAALGLGAYLALKQEITPGMMIAGSILIGKALGPLDQLIATHKLLTSARISYDRLIALLADSPAPAQGLPLPPPEPEIRLENVSAGPPMSAAPTIEEINIQIPAGSVVGLIGPSGAGKSTLVRTMIGVWAPRSGVARIGGSDLQTWDRERLGPHIGYLPQDVELFEGTVAENISRFGQDVDPGAIIKAAVSTGIHDLILKLPKGYDTVLGPQGLGLSGGQRQRIALARALFGDPRFVVLDEPNASLDDVGVQALIQSIVNLKAKGTTVVVVTHRSDLLRITDSVLLMQGGRVARFGPTSKVLEGLLNRVSGGGQNAA